MKLQNAKIFALIPIILSIGIIPAIPSSEALQEKDVETQCREGLVLVYRINANNYACISESTADKWERYGIAERVESAEKETVEQELTSEIELPPYPDLPDYNPLLEEHQKLHWPPTVYQLSDNVWVAVGYGLANSAMIEGDDGIIIIDSMMTYEAAKKIIEQFRKITDKPVVAIISTHSHPDHIQGTAAFLEEGDDIEIIFNERLVPAYSHEFGTLSQIAALRGLKAFGWMLPEHGPDRFGGGAGPFLETGTNSFVFPTKTFDKELDVEISGVQLQLRHVGGESGDQILVWMPEGRIAFVGDNIYHTFPNLYTIRGAVCRQPMDYVHAHDEIIRLDADVVVSFHGPPIIGEENVKKTVTLYRDATQYVYDQTIRGMNNGMTSDELAASIKLPDVFKDEPFLREIRGEIDWHVRNLFVCNLGWFQGDSAFLNPISQDERAKRIVDAFGGVEQTIQAVRDAITNDDVNWAAELATYVIEVDDDNLEAKLLKAQALRILGQQTTTADGRNWYLTEALLLEGKIGIDPTLVPTGNEHQFMNTPIETLLAILQTRVDPEKAGDVNKIVGIEFPDLEKHFTLHLRNHILAVTDQAPENADISLSMESVVFKKLIIGTISLEEAIQSGTVNFQGNRDDIEEFLSVFDSMTVTLN